MYHCTLKIAVFTVDQRLGQMVRSLQPLEGFTHDVALHSTAEMQAIADNRIILWDLSGVPPAALRRAAGPDALLVLCAGRKELDGYADAELEAADEIWGKPLHDGLTERRLYSLLRRIKLYCDHRLTEAVLETAINNSPDIMWVKAQDGTHTKVNRAFCAMVGKTREDVTGRDHCYIWGVSHDDPNSGEAECRATEEAVVRAGRTLQFVEHVKGPQGMRQLTTYKSPLYDWDGNLLGTVGLGHDVTDLRNLSTELEILLQSMPYGILLRDKEDHIQNVNQKFEEYFGVKVDAVVGKLYGEWNAAAFMEGRSVNNEGFVEATARAQEGEGRTLEIHEEPIYDIFRNEVGKLCIFRDVTIERKLEATILLNSNTDFMTALYNRRCLYQYVNNNCKGKTVSLLYVDLDRFKAVNDTYGHKVGDDALILTAGLLRDCFPDDFVARIGGDEFLIVKIGSHEIPALEWEAQRLLDRLRQAYDAAEHLSDLSASVGIAQHTSQDFDIDLLIQQSDAALYQAKQSGRSRCCVFHELTAASDASAAKA